MVALYKARAVGKEYHIHYTVEPTTAESKALKKWPITSESDPQSTTRKWERWIFL